MADISFHDCHYLENQSSNLERQKSGTKIQSYLINEQPHNAWKIRGIIQSDIHLLYKHWEKNKDYGKNLLRQTTLNISHVELQKKDVTLTSALWSNDMHKVIHRYIVSPFFLYKLPMVDRKRARWKYTHSKTQKKKNLMTEQLCFLFLIVKIIESKRGNA